MATVDSYSAESIQVLSGMQAVRKRPGMYVGDVTDGSGMHAILWEVMSNAIDEHVAGHAKHLHITFEGARVTIEDDGRSIPPEALELVLTTLHAGTRWRSGHAHLSRGMHGVGVSVTCALARELEATVWRDGHEHVQRFERGEAITPLEHRGSTTRSGLRISFVPDFSIFTERPWDVAMIAARCHTLAGLLPGVTISVGDHTWRYDSLVEYVEHRAGCDVIDPFVLHTRSEGVAIDLALAWTRGDATAFDALVNCSPCGTGVHVDALRAALYQVLAPRFPNLARRTFDRRLARGLVGVMHLQLDHPRFGNPTRDWLRNPEVGAVVREVVTREFARHLDEVPALVDVLVLDFTRPRRRHARDTVRTVHG
jgi:DNA gyrase subunit B